MCNIPQLHIVHFKSSHGSLGAAVGTGESDALAVLGFFFEVNLNMYYIHVKYTVSSTRTICFLRRYGERQEHNRKGDMQYA